MWTAAALKSEAVSFAAPIWRVVEEQWKLATVRITDTLDEQALLEQILDDVKPSFPPETAGFDFLIATPFRYAPYPEGSRFRRAGQAEGVFYGSETPETAIAEMAFYRLLFFKEAPGAALPAKPTEYTAFKVRVKTQALSDLTQPPLDADAAKWTDRTTYGPCQDFADVAREAEIEAIRYTSVRDPDEGNNIAVLSLKAFASTKPEAKQTWYIYLRPQRVQVWCEHPKYEREYANAWFAADLRVK
jgi:hypothetical protein